MELKILFFDTFQVKNDERMYLQHDIHDTSTFLLLGNDTMMLFETVKKKLKCHGHLFLFLCEDR